MYVWRSTFWVTSFPLSAIGALCVWYIRKREFCSFCGAQVHSANPIRRKRETKWSRLTRCWIIRFLEWREEAICQCCSATSPKLCLQVSQKTTLLNLIRRRRRAPPKRFLNFRKTRRNLSHCWLPNRVTRNCRKVCGKRHRRASFVSPSVAEENAVSTRMIAGPLKIWPSMDFTHTGNIYLLRN